MKFKIFLIIALWATQVPAPAFGQGEFMVRPFSSIGKLQLKLRPKPGANGVTESAKLQTYEPNVTNFSGIVVGHKGFSMTFGGTVPPSDAAIREKGETDYRDYQFQFYFNHIGIDLFYQTFEGFYRSSAEESEKSVLSDGTKAFPQLADMQMKKYGANLWYVFSPQKYSITAAFNQTSRQTQTGGSWIAMMSANDINISNKGAPILPESQRAEFGVNGNINGARLKSLGGLLGAGYTFASGGWYLSLQGLGGLAAQQFKGNGLQNTATQNVVSKLYNVRGSLGYNGQTFFIGFMWLTDQVTTEVDGLEIEPASMRAEVFLGARF
ncbi:MAG: DUF4421 family protein [Bdellovibrio sp.]|nr:DUF4421 family protein [Bdellovibrio sp.]